MNTNQLTGANIWGHVASLTTPTPMVLEQTHPWPPYPSQDPPSSISQLTPARIYVQKQPHEQVHCLECVPLPIYLELAFMG